MVVEREHHALDFIERVFFFHGDLEFVAGIGEMRDGFLHELLNDGEQVQHFFGVLAVERENEATLLKGMHDGGEGLENFELSDFMAAEHPLDFGETSKHEFFLAPHFKQQAHDTFLERLFRHRRRGCDSDKLLCEGNAWNDEFTFRALSFIEISILLEEEQEVFLNVLLYEFIIRLVGLFEFFDCVFLQARRIVSTRFIWYW